MWLHAGPVAFVLFAWWFSTGAIAYVAGRPERTHKWSMAAATLALVAAFWVLYRLRDGSVEDTTAAYAAFGSALVIWGWQELAFLLGYVTGPRRQACPDGALGWRRAGYAFQVVLHHEVALLVLGAAVLALMPERGPPVAAWTFGALWAMRQSAKLNVFFGVRNLNEQFLPPKIAYVQSYFRRRPMNALFPASMALAIAAAVLSWRAAMAADITALQQSGLGLVATLLTLGAAEHGLMVLPLPSHGLWRWWLDERPSP
ncbi:MAG: putative photosynthetic complex assembly protein PuhE [Rubrivivax sp.]